jgi:hypothetical protein
MHRLQAMNASRRLRSHLPLMRDSMDATVPNLPQWRNSVLPIMSAGRDACETRATQQQHELKSTSETSTPHHHHSPLSPHSLTCLCRPLRLVHPPHSPALRPKEPRDPLAGGTPPSPKTSTCDNVGRQARHERLLCSRKEDLPVVGRESPSLRSKD